MSDYDPNDDTEMTQAVPPEVPVIAEPPTVYVPPLKTFDVWVENNVLDNRTTRADYALNAINVAKAYGEIVGLSEQFEYMRKLWEDPTKTDMKFALSSYVNGSMLINQHARENIYNQHVKNLDAIFEEMPPLTQPITVYRMYTSSAFFFATELDKMSFQNQFLSTSLSLAYVTNRTFHGDKHNNTVYIRMDLVPGMKIIPVFNWLKWNTIHPPELTQFEIILPRRAKLYTVPWMLVPEWTSQKLVSFINDVRLDTNLSANINFHVIIAPQGSGSISFQFNTALLTTQPFGGGNNNTDDKLLLYYGDEVLTITDEYKDDMLLSEKLSLQLIKNKLIEPIKTKTMKTIEMKTIEKANKSIEKNLIEPTTMMMKKSPSMMKKNNNNNKQLTIRRDIFVGGKKLKNKKTKRKNKKTKRKINKLNRKKTRKCIKYIIKL
jgi:hypothetical protein